MKRRSKIFSMHARFILLTNSFQSFPKSQVPLFDKCVYVMTPWNLFITSNFNYCSSVIFCSRLIRTGFSVGCAKVRRKHDYVILYNFFIKMYHFLKVFLIWFFLTNKQLKKLVLYTNTVPLNTIQILCLDHKVKFSVVFFLTSQHVYHITVSRFHFWIS